MAKVLVVDDSLSVRKVVERALIGRQIEVVCAATGTEALERIEREAPDVVVCDVVMPDRDGYEICEFVKKHPRLSRTPVLLMSGIVNDEVRERAARVQSADVLTKPFAAIDGVQWAVLVDREGFLLDASAEAAVDPETAGALSAGLVESSEGLGRELGRGVLQGMILEYEQGIIVLYNVGVAAILAIG